MSHHRVYPSQEDLRNCFEDKGTHLIWKIRRKGVKQYSKAGSLSGCGYWQIWFNNENWKAHRLMWILRHGPIPDGYEVDHINGNKLDNEDRNHRLSTRSENARNIVRPENGTGYTGVRYSGPWGYQAYIKLNGKQIALGTYKTPEEASAARKAAEEKYHGEFTFRGS